jgi:hypothetical protein
LRRFRVTVSSRARVSLLRVAAGGCARHVRQPGELAARECLAAHQGRQHHGARGVADQRRNLDHVGSGNHAAW